MARDRDTQPLTLQQLLDHLEEYEVPPDAWVMVKGLRSEATVQIENVTVEISIGGHTRVVIETTL